MNQQDKPKRLFVTGGTGFIGSHFLNEALAAGHSVYALRRQNSKPRIPLKQEPIWVEGDLKGNFQDVLSQCDTVVHIAAHNVIPPYDSLEKCLEWNLSASLALFQEAYSVGIKQFLIIGSCFEYGKSAERYANIPVSAPLEPNTPYATSKAAASIVFQGWATASRVQLKMLRIFHVFGEGEDPKRLWPSLGRAALAGADYPMTMGEQIRDFIPVEEVAQRFVSELNFEDTPEGYPKIKNVGTGKPQTVLAFSQYWWQHWAAKGKLLPGALPYRENEVMRFVPECE